MPFTPMNNVKMIITKKKILPRRKCVPTVSNYEELDVDDSYIYCEECGLEYVDFCVLHPLVQMRDTKVAVGVADRARLTLPAGLSLSKSKIKGAGQGVWTDTKISKFTCFGPYEGVEEVSKDVKTDKVSGYGWLVAGNQARYIDGKDVTIANWLRYVNCARTKDEQNLEAFQYRGKIYYKTLTDIPAGHELLVWYGDDYALDLGIDEDDYVTSTLLNPGCGDVNTQHYKDISKQLKCRDCDFMCVLPSQLNRHSRKHAKTSRPFVCTQCDYRSEQSFTLRAHMRTHTGEKPFECTQCDYKSARSYNLQRHMRTHTGKKPFACSKCDYRCTDSCSLQRHMRTHTGEKPFACPLCDYMCARSCNLRTHMRTHTGEKPFACTHCDYRCTQLPHLQKHIRTHIGGKLFACTQCSYRCAYSSQLQKHMQGHVNVLN